MLEVACNATVWRLVRSMTSYVICSFKNWSFDCLFNYLVKYHACYNTQLQVGALKLASNQSRFPKILSMWPQTKHFLITSRFTHSLPFSSYQVTENLSTYMQPFVAIYSYNIHTIKTNSIYFHYILLKCSSHGILDIINAVIYI